MSDSQPQPDSALIEPERPFPPRFRQLKRWALVAILILTTLGALRLWWGYEAQRRLDALLADARSHGRKILITDYTSPSLANEENAAYPIRQAAAAIGYTQEQIDWDNSFEARLPLSTTDLQIIESLAAKYNGHLLSIREARGRVEADWGVRLRSPVMMTLLPFLNDARKVANTTRYIALYRHTRGDDREAVELARDILFNADALRREPVFLITYLVSTGVDAVAVNLLLTMAPDLKVAVSRAVGPQPASPDQVRAVIVQLLDDAPRRQGLARAFESEQMAILDNIPFFAKTQIPQPFSWIFEPMFVLDSVRAAETFRISAVTVNQSDYPTALALASSTSPGKDSDYPLLAGATRIMSRVIVPARPSNATAQRYFRNVADRRSAAISLAIRLYALDHDGRLPARLKDLVPDYLAKLPPDPFAADDRPFVYHPQDAEPMLYSLGPNGIDDGGKLGSRNAELDYVYRLRPARRDVPEPSAPSESTP